MSTPNSVIDLTDDTEPVPTRSLSVPRGRRVPREGTGQGAQTSLRTTEDPEVIDLDDEQEAGARAPAPSQEQGQRDGHRGGSPDVEFLYSNASQPPPRAPSPVEPRVFENVFQGNNSSDPFHLAGFMRYVSRMTAVAPSRTSNSRALDSTILHIARHRHAAAAQRQRHHNRLSHPTTATRFLLPELDYTTLGFSPPPPAGPPRPRATYTKPPAPREGFTRAPGEDDIVVCPNCNHELGSGDDDTRRQIWVVKACGHVSRTLHAVSSNANKDRPTVANAANYAQKNPRQREGTVPRSRSANALLRIVA